MTPEKFVHLVPYLLSTGLSLAILLYAWNKRSLRGARAFFLYMVWETLWMVSYLAGLISEGYTAKLFWDGMKWVSGLLAIVTIPYFVTSYLDFKIKHPWFFFALLSIIPFLFFLVILTDSSLHLMYIDPVLTKGEVFSELSFDLSWVILTVAFYAYAVALGSFTFLITKVPKTSRYFRAQLVIIVVGGLMPILGTVFAIGDGRLLPLHDLSPFFGGIGNLILAWGLFRFRMFEFLPIARETIVENMDDVVVVLDARDRIVDINKQALKKLDLKLNTAIGMPASSVITWRQEITEILAKPGNYSTEMYFNENGVYTHYDIQSTILDSPNGEYLGRVLVARDVSSYAHLQWELKTLNEHLEERVAEQTKEIAESYETTLEGWAKALELRDKETEGHSRRVVEETVQLARALGVSDQDIEHIRRGAILHDIGKMGIPDEILLKPGKLTVKERQVIEKHPIAAFSLLETIPYLRKAIDIPYCHHERWNGKGYPLGLKGEQIPLAARIFSVVDVWDALCSDRSYSKAWPPKKALQYIAKNSGVLFDPQVVKVFLARFNEVT